MQALVWIGAGLTLSGVALLLYCILIVARARRAGLEEEAFKARLQRVVALNMAALALSGLGLMVVVLGLVLG